MENNELLTPGPETVVNEIFALYEKHGDEDYIGEPVSQLEQMSQAALLAQNEGADDEVILAAFFHDLGHLCADESGDMDGFGKIDHEKLGADYLRSKGFSERVAALVESHVIAKRYLTYKYPDYYNALSEASKATLQFQGGVMTEPEATEFEQQPDFALMLRLRYWDDQAKMTNQTVSNLTHLKAITLKHLENKQTN